MSADEVLRESENTALSNNQFVSNVSGKARIKSNKSIKSWGAMGFLTAMIIVIAVLFSGGNIIPSAISERLIEETDVQYADAVESKKLVFQQALINGEIPEDTARILKENGVLVGYYAGDNFNESNKNENGELILKFNDKNISANDFITEVNNNINLYNAFNLATYSRAAYYYDESAKKVFKNIGTSRNNYTSELDFNEVMDDLIGKGSNINVGSVSLTQKEVKNEQTGETETVYEYIEGNTASSRNNVNEFINGVINNNLAGSETEATLNSASALNTADTISKEQRSSLFYAIFMENISKMKAGEGNESKIHEAMNYLYESKETEIVDVKTGEVVKISGTPLDSPSLYAILADKTVNISAVDNFSSDRIINTINNKLNNVSNNSISNTITSSSSDIRGTIGRFNNNGNISGSSETLNLVAPTINSSLKDNSYETIKGINAGEFLVEGAVNVGKELAKASGGTAGDAEAVVAYSRLNSRVIAMDAATDRFNKNPFDITSKNTFLGSIFYNFAINLRKSNNNNIKSLFKTINSSVISLLPTSFADSENSYLTSFGNCKTYETIGAVGSAQCAEITTFDPTTLNDTFNDPSFINFVEQNTTLSSSGTRTINNDSVLGDFILYNNERETPLGVVDGGILDSLSNNSNSISFSSSIVKMVESFLSANDNNKRIASGAAYVNSSSNPDWQTYKYAQRYVSLARATAALRQYAGSSEAYNNIAYFEGNYNPVIAFLEEYYDLANH